MQIRYVNKALQRFDSTQVIPIQFVMFTLCVIIGSAVLYRDFEKTTTEQAAKFVGGCLLTFFGVFLITSGRQRKDEDEDCLDDADGIDETIGLINQEGNPTTVSDDESRHDIPSRRSSKVSRVSFAEPFKTGYQDEPEEAATMRPKMIAGTPPSPILETPGGQSIASSPRAARTLSSNSVVSAPAPSITDVPPTPPTLREPPVILPGAERPVTPRANTTTPKSTTRDRDRTFYSPSPLYSTVKTVVSDALRENTNNQSSLRRIRSSIRASLFIDSDEEDQGQDAHDTQQTLIPSADNDLLRVLTATETEHEPVAEPGRQRARSLSETVGSFFRSKKKKAKNSDVESGPSTDDNGESGA